MMNLVESAAQKEQDKVAKKLEKKARIAKIIEEKDAKKEVKAEKKKEKLVSHNVFCCHLIDIQIGGCYRNKSNKLFYRLKRKRK